MHLDEVTQSVAEQLGHPVIVFDYDLDVIAFSRHGTEVDRGRLATILSHRATPVAVEMIAQSRARAAVDPVLLPPFQGVEARVLVPLRHDGHLYGYLSFAPPEKIDEQGMRDYGKRLAPASERIAAILAVRDLADRDDAATRQTRLEHLFSTDPGARTSAANDLVTSNMVGASDNYTTVVIRSRKPASSDASTTRLELESALRDLVRSSAFQAVGGILDAAAVVVLPEATDVDTVERMLHKQGDDALFAGVGSPRPELAEMVGSRREAQIAATAAQRLKDSPVMSWADLGVDRLLLQLPLDSVRRGDLPDALQRLLLMRSGIDLVRTLDCYLRCGGEAQETARLLHIHRSTLYYRLDKIRETTGLDLSDGLARRELHTGLRVAQLAGLWND